MTDMQFYVYDVGHGVCTLLTGKREFEGKKVPYCGIFDCGTKSERTLRSMSMAIKDMAGRIQGSMADCINDVFISHQDKDHWSGIYRVFESANQIPEGDVAYGEKWGNKLIWACVRIGDYSYHIKNNSYRSGRNSKAFHYIVAVEYTPEQTISSLHIHIKKFDENAKCNIHYYGGNNILIDRSNYRTRVKKSVCDVMDEVLKHLELPPKRLIDAINDIKYCFSKDMMEKVNEGKEGISKSIKIPINSVRMGGTQISDEYENLKAILSNMIPNQADNFSWEEHGAYIIMDENGIIECDTVNYPESDNIYELREPNDDVIARNLTSIVVQFNTSAHSKMLLPGDITVHGLIKVLNKISLLEPGELQVFLAPHHGSDGTNFAGKARKNKQPPQPLIDLFQVIKNNHPHCILIISAFNSFNKHPGPRFMDEARKYIKSGVGTHKYACATGKKTEIDKKLHVFEDAIKIYTTNVITNPYILLRQPNMPSFSTTRKLLRNLPPDNSFI